MGGGVRVVDILPPFTAFELFKIGGALAHNGKRKKNYGRDCRGMWGGGVHVAVSRGDDVARVLSANRTHERLKRGGDLEVGER